MFIHLYSKDTWGIVEDKLSSKDIEISSEELDEIILKQNGGYYFRIKNENATNLNELFEIVEIIKPIVLPTQEDRLKALEDLIMEVI